MNNLADPPAILLVEDEPLVRALVCDQLRSFGYTVRTAGNGDEAGAMIRAGMPFDLLLTDIRMPGTLDGFALIELARAYRPALRTVAMSGYVGADRLDARAVDGFISKPFTYARLEREISGLLPIVRH